MTLPRLAKPALIEIPSLARSPEACVFFSRSLPAKSTKCSLLSIVTKFSPEPDIASSGTDRRFSFVVVGADEFFFWTRFRLKTACERDDFAFWAVASVWRMEDPKFKAFSRSSTEFIVTCVRPARMIRPPGSSRMATSGRCPVGTVSESKRSRSCSL